ncbi:DNA repair protein RAD52 [Spironucleus salmonicida]|uniref:DNA repair protein RAD52 n=2 Tax=Spironucleus salmonicida TaxID=348837 RepID=V6M533_9EUKA|nr:DNA repair protein RAD52 [Spironucleus salmonicida]|eukprot:EST48469.1 DNA repair protein RAD52 [Spironucleus salmonicida]
MLPNFGTRQLNQLERTLKVLSTPLTKQQLAYRQGPRGTKIPYLEVSLAIQQANQAFGPCAWSSEIKNLQQNYLKEDGDQFRVSFSATVRVSLENGCFHEDIGQGNAERRQLSEAIEHAQKGAVSDAVKRCLRYFGDGVGNRILKDGGRDFNVTYTQNRHDTVLAEVVASVQLLAQCLSQPITDQCPHSITLPTTTVQPVLPTASVVTEVKQENDILIKPKIFIGKRSSSPVVHDEPPRPSQHTGVKIKLLRRSRSQKLSQQ